MNKVLKTIQSGLVILFVVISFYLMIFNWRIFTVSLDIDYGFGSVNAPIVLVVDLIGLMVILLFWLIAYMKDLRYEMKIMKTEDALLKLSDDQKPINPDLTNSLEDKIAKMQEQIDVLKNAKMSEKDSFS